MIGRARALILFVSTRDAGLGVCLVEPVGCTSDDVDVVASPLPCGEGSGVRV